jgi:hypothetical protein
MHIRTIDIDLIQTVLMYILVHGKVYNRAGSINFFVFGSFLSVLIGINQFLISTPLSYARRHTQEKEYIKLGELPMAGVAENNP